MADQAIAPAGTERVEVCDLCGSAEYDELFPSVRDRFYNLPGRFSLVRCAACSLVRLSPRPDAASLPRYYPADDYYSYEAPVSMAGVPDRSFAGTRETLRATVLRARGYDNVDLPLWARIAPKRPARWLVRRATYGFRGFPEWVPDGRALDLGCGNGLFLHCIRRHGWDVVGVELSADAAKAARDTFNITVHVGDLNDAPIEDQSLDFVHMSHVIEHMPYPMETLRRVASLLRPGGSSTSKLRISTLSGSSGVASIGIHWKSRVICGSSLRRLSLVLSISAASPSSPCRHEASQPSIGKRLTSGRNARDAWTRTDQTCRLRA